MDLNQLNSLIVKLNNESNQVTKIPRDYGIGQLLYASEIHTLEHIDKYPDYNVTKLANAIGVSKATISSLAKKLVKKGLLTSYKRSNQKEIYYIPTNIGKEAINSHHLFHEQQESYLGDAFSQHSEQELEIVYNFINDYIEYLHKYLKDETML